MTDRNATEGADGGEIVVVGAGPAGLTAAYTLVKAGEAPLVLEKDPIVGGIARTERYDGYRFDMGGHRFFTKSGEVRAIWRELLAGDFLRRPRLSRIYYRNHFFHYPLRPLNALTGLGVTESVMILLSYLRWRLFPYVAEDTFAQWVTNRFGRRLFRTFFQTYTEKVWGMSTWELSAEWAAQRIKNLSLKSAVLGVIRKPGDRIVSLIEEFDYPRLGPGMMWEAAQARVDALGGRVLLRHDVTCLHRNGRRIERVTTQGPDGDPVVVPVRHMISSMPITEAIAKLDPPAPEAVREAASQLYYRDFLTVGLIVDQPDLFPDNWIYVHDPEVKVGRIQNFKNWSPEMVAEPGKTSLGLEYFCNEGDQLWTMPDDELIELGKREVERLGLANGSDVVGGCVFRVPKSYPVYDSSYRDHLAVVRAFVDDLENFQTIGRNGLHRYNNQDHAMLTGLYAVRNLLDGGAYDLWDVNADQTYHEEIAEEHDPSAEAAVRGALARAFQKLDPVALGMACGTIAGAGLLLATLILVGKGGEPVGPTLSLLGQYFPGFRVSAEGSLLGLVYGFSAGFLGGWSFGVIRNATVLLATGADRLRPAPVRLVQTLKRAI
jgi:protoporphyrinogen oxidase